MTEIRSLPGRLQRPRLLIRAARHGLADYRRERDLKRLIGTGGQAGPDAALPRLMQEEERMETRRLCGDLGYSFARHIDLLIAVIAEARLLPDEARP